MANVTQFPISTEGRDLVLAPVFCEEQAVRMMLRNDEPWFVLADLCKAYDIKNSRDVAASLDDDEKHGVVLTDSLIEQGLSTATPGTIITVVNEAGMYSVTGRSTKPVAKKFWKRVRTEVLPTIRKTGRYAAEPAQPLTRAQLARNWAEAEERAEALEATVAKRDESLSVASTLLNTFSAQADSMTITKMGKLFNVSRRNTFKTLRDDDFLYKGTEAVIPREDYVLPDRKGQFFEYKYHKNDDGIWVDGTVVRPIGVINFAIHFIKKKLIPDDPKHLIENMETWLYAIDTSKLSDVERGVVEKTKKRLDKLKAEKMQPMFPDMFPGA